MGNYLTTGEDCYTPRVELSLKVRVFSTDDQYFFKVISSSSYVSYMRVNGWSQAGNITLTT